MDKPHRKPGRLKATMRTLPLVLEAELNVSKIEIALPITTAETLTEYVTWVQRCGDKTVDAATTATVDFALRELFRRDRLWRDERRVPEPPPAAKLPPSPSPALPPPAGTTRDPRAA